MEVADADDGDEDEGDIRLSNITVKIRNIHNNGDLCISMRIQNIPEHLDIIGITYTNPVRM